MPKFDLDYSNKLFGPVRSAYLLMIGTHIYLAADMLVKMLFFMMFNKLFKHGFSILHDLQTKTTNLVKKGPIDMFKAVYLFLLFFCFGFKAV